MPGGSVIPPHFILVVVISMMFFLSGLDHLGQHTINPVNATTNANTTSEADPALFSFLTNPTGNFNATGTISSLVLDNRRLEPQYVLSGNWNVNTSNGNIIDFGAHFTMVSVNGTDRHTHSITNFNSNVVAPLILDIYGTTFTGESDITTFDDVTWRAIQTTVTIARQDTIKITFHHNNVNNHFQNQPIYGVVSSIQEYEGPT